MGYHDSKTPKEIRDSWATPRKLFDALNEEFGFVLDAAASDSNALCDDYFTIEDDALNQPWNKGGYVCATLHTVTQRHLQRRRNRSIAA